MLLLGSKKEKRWFGRFYEDVIESGRVHRIRRQEFLGTLKDLPTKKLAMRELDGKRLVAINSPSYRPRPTATFAVFAGLWMEQCRTRKRRPLKPSTILNWQNILDKHVLPVLKDIPLSDVSNRTMKEFVEILVGKGLASQTIQNITQVVKLVKASAKDEDGNELYPAKWNHAFIDMPAASEKRQPSFTTEQVAEIVKAASGRMQMAAILFAATGMRAGELLGLEVRHFDGASIVVEQAVWGGKVQRPKTPNAKRVIDLHPDVANLLRQYVGNRSAGFIFQTSSGKPISQPNLLKREFHPILETLGISKRGFHSFRRFRNTYLRKSQCPDGLIKFWMGHAKLDMTDVYDRVREDVEFRKDVARSMGVGCELPKSLTVRSKEGGFRTRFGRELVDVRTEVVEKAGVSDGI